MTSKTLAFKLSGRVEPGHRRSVWLDGMLLNRDIRSLDVVASEFAWGYSGSGAHELSKAILAQLISVKYVQEHPECVQQVVDQVISRVTKVDGSFDWEGAIELKERDE